MEFDLTLFTYITSIQTFLIIIFFFDILQRRKFQLFGLFSIVGLLLGGVPILQKLVAEGGKQSAMAVRSSGHLVIEVGFLKNQGNFSIKKSNGSTQ